MPPAYRKTDPTTGHPCHVPPTIAQMGSPNVKTNGLDQMRVTDPCVVHACPMCPYPPHIPKMSSGSSTVYVNGLKACRAMDSTDCADKAASGSPDVNIGG